MLEFIFAKEEFAIVEDEGVVNDEYMLCVTLADDDTGSTFPTREDNADRGFDVFTLSKPPHTSLGTSGVPGGVISSYLGVTLSVDA